MTSGDMTSPRIPTHPFVVSAFKFLAITAAPLALALATSDKANADPGLCFEHVGPRVQVAEVVDARTLQLSDGRRTTLAGIELASRGSEQDGFTHAKSWLSAHGPEEGDTIIRLLGQKTDRYGRYDALIADQGMTLQEGLLQAGLAVMRPDDTVPPSCLEAFMVAEGKARLTKNGIWRDRQIALLPAADYDEILERVGRFAIVEGKVLSVGTRKNRTYLNFGTYWSQDMTVEIDARDRDEFGGADALEQLTWQTVRVRG